MYEVGGYLVGVRNSRIKVMACSPSFLRDRIDMLEQTTREILEEACQVEILISNLYQLFERTFPEDAQFWKQLAREERNHASLLGGLIKNPGVSDENVPALFPHSLTEIGQGKERLLFLIQKFTEAVPDRRTAFSTAIDVEKTAGEAHYQDTMAQQTDSWLTKVFQKLNGYDLDHVERLKRYATEHEVF